MEMAAISALLCFYSGAKAKYRVMKLQVESKLCLPVRKELDIQRVNKTEKRPSELYKRGRRATKKVVVRIEEANIQIERSHMKLGPSLGSKRTCRCFTLHSFSCIWSIKHSLVRNCIVFNCSDA